MKKLVMTFVLALVAVAVGQPQPRRLLSRGALDDGRNRLEERNSAWRDSVFDATNRPLSAATSAVEWRRGVDTNCVTISVVTGIVGGRNMGAHAERDLTFDAEGRLVSVSPVCRVMYGTNDVLRAFREKSRGD